MYYLKQITFCILLSLCVAKVQAQNSQQEEASRLFYTADSLFKVKTATALTDSLSIFYFKKAIDAFGVDSLHLQVEAHQKIGNLFEVNSQMDSALAQYRSSIIKSTRLNPAYDTLKFYANVYCGDAHHYLENYDSADYYYSRAENYLALNIKESEVLRYYNSSGLLYFNTGNYQRAINYLEKSKSLNLNNAYVEAIINNNLAIAYDMLGKYSKSIPIYRALISHHNIPDAIFKNLGAAYVHLENYDSAKYFLKRAIKSKQPVTKFSGLNFLAKAYFQENKIDSATLLYQQSIDENLAQSTQNQLNLAGAYLGIAKIYLFNQDTEQALAQLQQALISATFDFDDQNYLINPTNINSAISPMLVFKIFNEKANVLCTRFTTSKASADLEAGLKNYQDAIQIARYIQKTFDNDEAKLFLVQNVYPTYEKAIASAHQLYQLNHDPKYIEQAFIFSEFSKAAVLAEILTDIEIKASLATSDSLIQSEKKQKQAIAQIHLQLIEEEDISNIVKLKQDLNDYEIELSSTIRLLQKDEKYFRLKYQQDTIDIDKIRANVLTKEGALIEYFLGADSLYSFILSKENIILKSQAIDSSFYQMIQETQSGLYDYKMGQPYAASAQAYVLYQKLIEPFKEIIQDKKQLIIIPDGQLNYIPFEILNVDPNANYYLIYDHAFSYAYSAILLDEAIQTRKEEELDGVLAMAPFAGDEEGNIRSNGFNQLFGSKEEVENIGGSIYLENQATKRLFLELVSSYGIIHLATHASIDNNNPLQSFIAFYPHEDESVSGYRLYTEELYNLHLDSVKLVVLSACEAGNGQLVKGEGIISLARAFAYAGCPNIITTLWKAQDKSTAEIASNLHEYLKEGYPKDEALRMAKLDYLQSEDIHPLLKTPYYWANFIFIGDPAPIYESSISWWWWILAGLVLMTGSYWLVKKAVFKL